MSKSSAAYITHITATVSRGIEIVDPTDYANYDLISFRDFMSELPTLGDDGLIYTAADPEQMEELKQEYSVK